MATTTPDRAALIERISAHLAELDDDTLRHVDRITQSGRAGELPATLAVAEAAPEQLSRRQLLAGLLAGGAAVAGMGAVAGSLAVSRTYDQGLADGRASAAADLDRMRGLVSLYDTLEKIELDQILSAGLASVGKLVGTLAAGVSALRSAVAAVESALARFEASLPAIRQGLAGVQRLAGDVAGQLDALRQQMGEGSERIQPLGDALGGFLSGVVKQLPLGIGDRAGRVFDAVGKLVATLPEMLAALAEGLLKPLAGWFPAEGTAGVEAGLFTPVRQSLLIPLDDYLDSAASLFEQWEVRLASPAQQALDERARVLNQITEYRREHDV